MKRHTLLNTAFCLAVSATTLPAFAAPATPGSLGSSAPASAATQVITITATTRHINVEGGATVTFVVGDKTFTWTFGMSDAASVPFDLQGIAPAGMLNHAVTAYVSPNPQYRG